MITRECCLEVQGHQALGVQMYQKELPFSAEGAENVISETSCFCDRSGWNKCLGHIETWALSTTIKKHFQAGSLPIVGMRVRAVEGDNRAAQIPNVNCFYSSSGEQRRVALPVDLAQHPWLGLAAGTALPP